jgi:hypothetical protein
MWLDRVLLVTPGPARTGTPSATPNDAVRTLRKEISSADLDRLDLTRRHELLQASGTDTDARVLNGLLSTELEERADAFADACGVPQDQHLRGQGLVAAGCMCELAKDADQRQVEQAEDHKSRSCPHRAGSRSHGTGRQAEFWA